MVNPDLPLDLIIEIFTRLPVRSLIQLTTVCKSWFFLIKSREFILKHLNSQSTLSDRFNNLVTWSDPQTPHHGIVRLSMFSYESFDEVLSFDPGSNFRWYFRYEDSCHGVFLICSRRFMALWNPATREFSSIPLSPRLLCENSFYRGALGYDPETDDYKVIVIHPNDGEENYSTIEVYSVSNNCWRAPSSSFRHPMPGLGHESPVFNGNRRICSWLSPFNNDCIISFDMTKEHIVETPLPCQEQKHKHLLIQSNEYQARLCCSVDLSHHQRDTELVFWVLNGEYGKGATWIKWFSVQFPEPLIADTPLWIWGNIRVVFLIWVSEEEPEEGKYYRKFLYEPLTQRIKSVGYGGSSYRESIVSIKALQEQNGVEPPPLQPELTGADAFEYIFHEATQPFIFQFISDN